ncbi:anaphase-promoting complex subunit Cut9 [Xanthoria parietina]
MQRFLKEWRQDAMHKHQYDSAIFIGDKLLALTNDPNDAFWLAQLHFQTGNYSRALTFLAKHKLLDHSPSCRYLAAHCCVKQSKFEDALAILGDKTPGHLLGNANKSRRKLQHTSGNARNGMHRKGSSRIEKGGQSEEQEREATSDSKYEAAMCFLRGVCFAKQNSYDRAKECYMDAVRIDVQCFEAFDQLMKNSLLPPDEEWEFLESLDFDSMTTDGTETAQEVANFTKMLYTTRLSKYKNSAEFSNAVDSLSQHYKLDTNPDLLLSKAELLFTQCRFKQALAITTSVLAADQYNFSFLPLHLACLHELHQPNTLFLLAHRLADTYPDEPATWLAVGVYYLSISQIAEARRFFSKASMMNPHFGPAWIGFAHTFALEGEHDQAVSAYGTAARLFQGTHLPQLFLGMQHLQLHNLTLAHEYLTTAYKLCSTDPLLLNETGVVFYHLDHLPEAINLFHQALAIADEIDSDPTFWLATRANLGHAYRRQHQWSLALGEFDEVLRQGSAPSQQADSNSSTTGRHHILAAKGLVLLEMGRTWEAIGSLHEALGVCPQDPVATDLLARALEENVGGDEGGEFGDEIRTEDQLEEAMEVKRQEMMRREARKTGRRGKVVGGGDSAGAGRARMSEGGEDSMMVMSDGDE